MILTGIKLYLGYVIGSFLVAVGLLLLGIILYTYMLWKGK